MKKCRIQAPGSPTLYVELPSYIISRSPILQDAVSLGSDAPSLALPFGMDFFDAWIQHGSMTSTTLSAEFAAKGIQAADFFADEAAVQQFARTLSLRMFPEQACTCSGPSRPQKERKTKKATHHRAPSCCQYSSVSDTRALNEKILSQLSTGLITMILAKAEVPLATCLQYLPSSIHPTAVSTKCSKGPSASCLTLSVHHTRNFSSYPIVATPTSRKRVRACEDPAVNFHREVLDAAASLTHVTSLTLSSSFLPGLLSNMDLRSSFCTLLLSLNNLSELMFSDGMSTACTDTLLAILPQMHSCTSLCFSSPHPRMTSKPPFCSKWSETIRGMPGYTDSIDDPDADSSDRWSTLVGPLPTTHGWMMTPKPADSSFNALLKQLKVLPKLQCLELAGTKPECTDILSFCAALKQLTGLKTLIITHCFVNRGSAAIGDGMKVTKRLGDSLKKLKLLEHLNLQGSLPGDIIDPVLDSILTLTLLTHLNLKSVHCMSVVSGPQHILALSKSTGFGVRLAPMLRALQKLQYLDLSECFMPTETMTDVVSAMCRLSCLTHLELQQVSREMCFWEFFSDKVSSLQRLQQLIISMNPCITNSNVGPLFKALSTLPDLQVLDIHFCRIGLDGATAMCQYLCQLTSLKSLDLQMNFIRPQGAKLLADCFKDMPSLQEVTLLDTDIGDLGEQVIIGALEESRGLDWGNQMWLTVIEDNPDLKKMYFDAGHEWFDRYWRPTDAGPVAMFLNLIALGALL